eukprot:GHUV01021035.1.p1 GENE.GHUV01021035.1~~GHUV01021035.1.p1  ORF type:complete len:149 (+),score=34.47 GHUV01021035.1:1077-1523(+)
MAADLDVYPDINSTPTPTTHRQVATAYHVSAVHAAPGSSNMEYNVPECQTVCREIPQKATDQSGSPATVLQKYYMNGHLWYIRILPYCCVMFHVGDEEDEDMVALFKEAFDFIDEGRKSGEQGATWWGCDQQYTVLGHHVVVSATSAA